MLRFRTQPGSLFLGAGNKEWMFQLVSGEIPAEQDDVAAFLWEIRPHMGASLVSQLARRVRRNPTPWSLIHLAVLLPPGKREAIVAQALDAISSKEFRFERGQFLAVLAPTLTPATLDSTLEAIKSIDYGRKAPVVREIALARIREGDPNGAVVCLEALGETVEPFAVLAALWDLLPEETRTSKAREHLSEAQLDDDPEGFQDLCRRLSGSQLREIALARSAIRDVRARTMFRFALAAQETGDPLPTLFHGASEPLRFSDALAILPIASPQVLVQVKDRILEGAEQQGSPYLWPISLSLFSKLLPEPHRSETRQRVWKIFLQMDDTDFLQIATDLENTMPEDLLERIADRLQGLQGAKRSFWMRPWTLQLLPAGLREERARELVRLAEQPDGSSLRQIRLALEFLPEQERQLLLPQWLRFRPEGRLAPALGVLATYLDFGQLQEALQAAREIEIPTARALATLGLLPYLPATDREKILREMFSTEQSLALGVESVAIYLFSEVFSEEQSEGIVRTFEQGLTPSRFEAVLQTTLGLPKVGTILLSRLASVACAFDRPFLCRIVQHALRPGRIRNRDRLFRELSCLAPVLVALGGEAQIPGIEAAIDAVCELFP